MFYQWRDNIPDNDNFDREASAYAFYRPSYKYPEFATIFCYVKTQEDERVLGRANITIEIEGTLLSIDDR